MMEAKGTPPVDTPTITTMSKEAEGPKRIGIALRQHVHERLQDVTTVLGITQSRLIEAIVSTMSLDELQEIMSRQVRLDQLEVSLHRKASREVLALARGKTSGQINEMAEAAKRAIDKAST